MEVKFVIPGEPVGKGRPRFSRQGNFVRTYTPEKTRNYEEKVAWEYKTQCHGYKFEKDVPLDMRIFAYYTIPQSKPKRIREAMLNGEMRPLKKVDSSNLQKAIEDALNGIAYHDDVQIVDSMCRRFYGAEPKVVVVIQEAKCEKKPDIPEKTIKK